MWTRRTAALIVARHPLHVWPSEQRHLFVIIFVGVHEFSSILTTFSSCRCRNRTADPLVTSPALSPYTTGDSLRQSHDDNIENLGKLFIVGSMVEQTIHLNLCKHRTPTPTDRIFPSQWLLFYCWLCIRFKSGFMCYIIIKITFNSNLVYEFSYLD